MYLFYELNNLATSADSAVGWSAVCDGGRTLNFYEHKFGLLWHDARYIINIPPKYITILRHSVCYVFEIFVKCSFKMNYLDFRKTKLLFMFQNFFIISVMSF